MSTLDIFTNQGPAVQSAVIGGDVNLTTLYTTPPVELGPIFFDVQIPDMNFVGRSEILKSIADVMNTVNSSNLIVIAGLGGVGKTQVVRKFIKENRSSYVNVVWINSETSESLNESFKRLASNKLKISLTNCNGQLKSSNDINAEVLDKLSKSKTLCVYDNVDKIEIISFLLTIEPSGRKPHVIITSRLQEWDVRLKSIDLKVWEFDEALEYVSTTLSDSMDSDLDKRSLIEKLQHFPLALCQATAYINYQRKEEVFRIADYVDKFDKSYSDTKKMIGSEIFKKDATNIYQKTTLTTWRMTIEAFKTYGSTGALARRILNIISYFNPDKIYRDFFMHLTLTSDSLQVANQAENVKSAVRLLINYSMVDGQKYQSVLSIHRLVQLVIKLDLRETEQDKPILRDALELISKLIKEKYLNLNKCPSHLISVYLSAMNFEDLVEEFSELPNKILCTLDSFENHNQMVDFGNKILHALTRILGEDHPQTIKVKHNVALLYSKVGKYSVSVQMFEEVLEIQKLVLGEDHPDTLGTRHNLAMSYQDVGKYSEAIKMYEEVLQKQKLVLREDHPETLQTKHNLADSYRAVGKNSVAMQMFEEVLEIQKLVLGEDHRDTLRTKHNLAISYQDVGKYSEAIKMYEEVLQKQNLVLVKDHPDSLLTRHNLADSYRVVGKHSDAMQMFEEVLEKQRMVLGDDHPHTLLTRHNLADSYQAVGKHSDAMQMFQKVLEKQKLVLGENHPDTLRTGQKLATSYQNIGKNSDAIQMLEVLEKGKSVLGGGHVDKF